MEHAIRPEPTDEERAAIVVALEQELPPEPDPRGAWWRAGLAESLRSPEPAPALVERARERVPPAGE